VECPWLDRLSRALERDWHTVREVGRLARHTEILRDVARVISADPEREDRPKDGAEAKERFVSFLVDLQERTPRSGLAAPTAAFVDNLAALGERYKDHLFVCFDDPLVHATTNSLEGFFSRFKHAQRRLLGTKGTANSLVQNLDDDYMLLFAESDDASHSLASAELTVEAFDLARAEIEAAEEPARERRSAVRSLSKHLNKVREAWAEHLAAAPARSAPELGP